MLPRAFSTREPQPSRNLPAPQPCLILLPKGPLLPLSHLLPSLEIPLQMCNRPGCSPGAGKCGGRPLGMGGTLTLRRQATASRTISELLSDSPLVSPQEVTASLFSSSPMEKTLRRSISHIFQRGGPGLRPYHISMSPRGPGRHVAGQSPPRRQGKFPEWPVTESGRGCGVPRDCRVPR